MRGNFLKEVAPRPLKNFPKIKSEANRGRTAPNRRSGVLRSRLRDARVQRASKISHNSALAELGCRSGRGAYPRPPAEQKLAADPAHHEVTDHKREESWQYNAIERRHGNRRFPPKARTVARLRCAGSRGEALVPFLSPFLCGTTKKWHPSRTARRAARQRRGGQYARQQKK